MGYRGPVFFILVTAGPTMRLHCHSLKSPLHAVSCDKWACWWSSVNTFFISLAFGLRLKRPVNACYGRPEMKGSNPQ